MLVLDFVPEGDFLPRPVVVFLVLCLSAYGAIGGGVVGGGVVMLHELSHSDAIMATSLEFMVVPPTMFALPRLDIGLVPDGTAASQLAAIRPKSFELTTPSAPQYGAAIVPPEMSPKSLVGLDPEIPV